MTPAARKKRAAAPKIDVVMQSDLWKARQDVRPVARRAIREAAALLAMPGAELAVVLTDDSAIRSLNRAWRGVDAPTNVLSFPTKRSGDDPPLIGDIVLAYETIAGEARSQHKPFAHHVAHLAVHGFLHLLGYDHVRDEDADVMERVELDVLQRLAIPDPYRHPPRRKSDA